MTVLECILLGMLIVCAVVAPLQKRLLTTVILYTVFGLCMSLIWMLQQAPDLAVTEAAVGVGVTGMLFFLTLKQVGQLRGPRDEE